MHGSWGILIITPTRHTRPEPLETIAGLQCSMFTMDEKPPSCIEYAREKVFGIDFDKDSAESVRHVNPAC